MNYEAVTCCISALMLLTVLFGVPYLAGKVTQRLDDGDKRFDEHGKMFEVVDKKLDFHSERIGGHDIELAKLTEWKSGYNAAANISGGHKVS